MHEKTTIINEAQRIIQNTMQQNEQQATQPTTTLEEENDDQDAAENTAMHKWKCPNAPFCDSHKPCKQQRRFSDVDNENDGQGDETVTTAAAANTPTCPSNGKNTHFTIQQQQQPEPKNQSSSGNNATATAVVYVSHLPARYGAEAIVEKMMQKYGTIVRIHTCHSNSNRNKTTHPAAAAAGRSTYNNKNHPFWFVEFASIQQAQNAMAHLHGRTFAGQSIVVRPAHQQPAYKQSTIMSSPSAASTNTQKQQQQQIHRVESQIRAIQNKLKSKK
jgi:hypothetical protein